MSHSDAPAEEPNVRVNAEAQQQGREEAPVRNSRNEFDQNRIVGAEHRDTRSPVGSEGGGRVEAGT